MTETTGKHGRPFLLSAALCASMLTVIGYAQVEATPWGNIMGIRTAEGQLLQFESSLRIVRPDWSGFYQTANYNEKPKYSRAGTKRTIVSTMDGLPFVETIEDAGTGGARVVVEFTPAADMAMAGAYLCIEVSPAEYAGGTAQLLSPASASAARINLTANRPAGKTEILRASARGIRLVSPTRQLEITMNSPAEIIVRQDLIERPAWLNDPLPRQSFIQDTVRDGFNLSAEWISYGTGTPNIQVYLPVIAGNAAGGRAYKNSFIIKAAGEIDRTPVQLIMKASTPGRIYDGIGGNFVVSGKKDKVDEEVTDYNLANLPVKWGRIGMVWAAWHADEFVDPVPEAKAGKLNERIYRQMELARKLNSLNIPVIVSEWTAPKWALPVDPDPTGLRGDPLNAGKMDRICESIASYLLYLKEQYGVEAALFSFNESDIGVNVRQTAEEHVALIKRLGELMVSKGLATKMLLGDTAHCTPAAHDFIRPALEDPETYKYIGAIGFHSWRGCTDQDLKLWSSSAKKLNVPLMATETGPDANAHVYPPVFVEPWFQLKEIDYYVRILGVGELRSIMEWQFTNNYSLLTGTGVYDYEGPLRPTQRFWNFKQMGLTPAGSFHLPVSADRPAISSSAFGEISRGIYSIHITNTGAARQATLSGIPDGVKELRYFVTDFTRGMVEGKRVPVAGGKAQFTLDAVSYTTLINSPEKQP